MVAPFAQNSGLLVPCPHFFIHLKLCTSRLCMKMSSFMYERSCAMLRTLYSSCGILFPLWTPDNISGLTSILCKNLLHDVFFTHPFNNFKSWIVWVTTVLIVHSLGRVRIYHSENAESAPSLRWEYC